MMEDTRRRVLDLLKQALSLMDEQGETLAAPRVAAVIDDLLIDACGSGARPH